MKIRQVGSNKTELHLSDGTVILFSYETPVAALIPGKGYVRTSTHYSRTTSKHIGQWLDGITAATVDQSALNALLDAPEAEGTE